MKYTQSWEFPWALRIELNFFPDPVFFINSKCFHLTGSLVLRTELEKFLYLFPHSHIYVQISLRSIVSEMNPVL